jgi:hypothetical protein
MESWSTGGLECLSAGVLEYWSIGVLVYWSPGVLECWSAWSPTGMDPRVETLVESFSSFGQSNILNLPHLSAIQPWAKFSDG